MFLKPLIILFYMETTVYIEAKLKHYEPKDPEFFDITGEWPDICEDLDPKHLNLSEIPDERQNLTDFPYQITCSQKVVEINHTITVTITSKEEKISFTNYIIQAHYGDNIVGIFLEQENVTTFDCFGFEKVISIKILYKFQCYIKNRYHITHRKEARIFGGGSSLHNLFSQKEGQHYFYS